MAQLDDAFDWHPYSPQLPPEFPDDAEIQTLMETSTTPTADVSGMLHHHNPLVANMPVLRPAHTRTACVANMLRHHNPLVAGRFAAIHDIAGPTSASKSSSVV